jgi:hypothetical protein
MEISDCELENCNSPQSAIRNLHFKSLGSGVVGTFVVHHSGATVRDLHPIPYSPLTVIRGTLSCFRAFAPQVFKEPKRGLRRCPKFGPGRIFCHARLATIFFTENEPKERSLGWLDTDCALISICLSAKLSDRRYQTNRSEISTTL